jgi:putative glycosyltransferase (TIGR04372 family)
MKNRSRKLEWATPLPYAVGNAAEELFFCLLRSQSVNGRRLVLFPASLPRLNGYETRSDTLMHLTAKEIIQLSQRSQNILRWLLAASYLPTRITSRLLFFFFHRRLSERLNFPRLGISKLWEIPYVDHKYSQSVSSESFWKRQRELFIPPMLNNAQNDACKEQLRELGVEKDDWFVCLHVRETGYRGDSDRKTYRNASIHDCVKGIHKVTQRGGWVVRLGDPTMTPLPPMERVIDYPFSAQKSGVMDLFLIQNCRFYVGMLSGPWDIAELFKKDKLGINIYDCSVGFAYGKNDRAILKHVFSVEKGRYLSLKELFSAKEDLMNINGVVSDAYRYVDNTEGEIADAVENYLQLMDGESSEVSLQQEQASRYWKKHALERLRVGTITGTGVSAERRSEHHRFKAKIEMSETYIDRTYLVQNWDQDSFEQPPNQFY